MATCLWVWLKWSHGLFDKNPYGSAEASRSARQWIELGTEVFFFWKYLLWTADATGKQETKTLFSLNLWILQQPPKSKGSQISLSLVAGSACLLNGFFTWTQTPQKMGWQRQSRLEGYCTIKITRGEKIMSLTLIHVAVRQLCNGLLLRWPLAFPLNRCLDDASDATETEITYNVKGHFRQSCGYSLLVIVSIHQNEWNILGVAAGFS